MGGRPGKGTGLLILLLLLCGLAGGLIGELLGQNIGLLSFLKNYTSVGMSQPVVLNLRLVSFTFGINFNINLLSLLGMIMGYFIYKKL
ncbi:DUF4321 domain-containing protein [Fonticella tunisiensis]|uniref:Uncharacterized protein DUF4321 n=1 Tax=Fonticella tunisiensis TaxID=1096341 RepID=A0A4R7KRF6_9CLOT|nr:DUF4321 domain-containing protein [Fonticella tunisiensis]TDT61193.1 uncharacterized protein DUF4321 [Fonticella tunisiensis]